MKLCLCTLVLNEIQWLQRLYDQHKDWNGVCKWVFVESADRIFADTNPHLVSSEGLSTDGTTEFLEELAAKDPRIIHIKHGFSSNHDPAQGKCEPRNRYLREIDKDQPNFFIVVDADEFYPYQCQKEINQILRRKPNWAFCFKHREIWFPPCFSSLEYNLFSWEVTGGFWDIPYCRVWKWFPNLSYVNHNTPSFAEGRQSLDQRMNRFDRNEGSPYFIHMGFASKLENRAAKNRYYEVRGEAVDRRRSWYCESRKAFETWTPETILPKGAKVIPFTGIIPEAFRQSPNHVNT